MFFKMLIAIQDCVPIDEFGIWSDVIDILGFVKAEVDSATT